MKDILTRTTGYLKTVCSHSLQPYRGCTYGASLCGVGCYVRANPWLTRGERWGSFLDVRTNAAERYRATAARERTWAHRRDEAFRVFLSSSTDPFVPQERRHGITRQVLASMLDEPPDGLVVQTHSPRVLDVLPLLRDLASRTALRVHVSIESDRDRLPGLPPPAASVARRLDAVARLTEAGLDTRVTVAPLLPIADPDRFFAAIAHAARGVVLDHFVGGDGSSDGSRTRRTPLVAAMEAVEPGSTALAYRDAMVTVAQRHLPGRVGVHVAGFAGEFLPR